MHDGIVIVAVVIHALS